MEAQMQELQRHLQQAVDSMMGRVDRSHMRPMQKSAYLCCARCFDSSSATVSDSQIQNCIQNCQQPVQYNQQVMQREMNAFQTRLQRCAEMCQDDAQQMVTPDMQHDIGKMDVVQNALVKCSTGCVDKSIASLPGLEKKLLSEMKSSNH